MILAAYCVILVLSNIGATKGVQIGPIITDGGFFLFPLAYVLGDVISEVYGFRAMRRTIYAGFAVLILASLCFWLTIHLPAADFYDGQQAFERVAGVVPQFLLAGLAGYVVGDPRLVAALAEQQPPWSVGSLAVRVILETATPRALAEAARGAAELQAWREHPTAGLRALEGRGWGRLIAVA